MEKPDILYEDRDLLVCFKPAGWPVQSASLRTQDLEHWLRSRLKENASPDGRDGRAELFPGVVHRLDQPVQGLVVFAKTRQAAAELSRQSREGEMTKEYLALVQPQKPERAAGEGSTVLEDYLLRDGKNNRSAVVPPRTKGAKRARLSYEDVTEDPAFSPVMAGREEEGERLLKIRLDTGRHHQIRVQLSHAGLPIAGDRKYGTGAAFSAVEKKRGIAEAAFREEGGSPAASGFRYPALCAYRLSFRHPKDRRLMEFSLAPGQVRFN